MAGKALFHYSCRQAWDNLTVVFTCIPLLQKFSTDCAWFTQRRCANWQMLTRLDKAEASLISGIYASSSELRWGQRLHVTSADEAERDRWLESALRQTARDFRKAEFACDGWQHVWTNWSCEIRGSARGFWASPTFKKWTPLLRKESGFWERKLLFWEKNPAFEKGAPTLRFARGRFSEERLFDFFFL